ncbi:MAG: rod shape-determining protein MreC [bacterium]
MLGLLHRHRSVLLSLLTLIVACAMLVAHRNRQASPFFLQRALLEVTGPFQKGITGGVRLIGGIWNRYFDLVHVQEENQALREIIKELKRERIQLLEERSENERLRGLLGFKERFESPLLPAEVIGSDGSGWFQTLVIDRGQRDGVQEGMAVMTVEGVVGQVMECSRNFSRVLLITDPNSSIAAVLQSTRAPGIVEGAGRQKCILKYLQQSETVEAGEVTLSSGVDGIYPKGLPIGTVSEVQKQDAQLFQYVEIQPFVRFDKLEEVFILYHLPRESEQPESP